MSSPLHWIGLLTRESPFNLKNDDQHSEWLCLFLAQEGGKNKITRSAFFVIQAISSRLLIRKSHQSLNASKVQLEFTKAMHKNIILVKRIEYCYVT